MEKTIYPEKKMAKTCISILSIPMKRIVIILAFTCLIAFEAFAGDQRVVLTVTNPLNLKRSSEMIVLRWNDLKQMISTLNMTNVLVFDISTNNELITQIIDEDLDGTPEELIFHSDFDEGETKQFILKAFDRGLKIVQPLTDARFMIPREDIAWENDRIAYRIYGPALAKEVNNGIDVWTKRVRYLIVEKWYKGDETVGSNRISYHEDHGEGADFFSVGQTLGAGSCALYKEDSLYQPGVFEKYKILATGPIRAMFEVTYKPIQFKGKSLSETKRITLDAGINLNKIEVAYCGDSTIGAVPFAAGIVKRKDIISNTDKENRWVSLWGLTNEKEENGYLGTGIVMTREAFSDIKENNIHILILGTIKIGKIATYYTGAGWTRSGDFNDAEAWNKYLKEFSQRVEFPLKVKLVLE
jgi:pectinesterase